jgi:2-oxo-4-hydroxy-4-carboxy-5-ureidoimidazoline decarboxylase
MDRKAMMTISDVNAMSMAGFVDQFGDIAEHSAWVAREAAAYRPFHCREAMIEAFENAVKSANRDARLKLIRAHPDLATKAKLTDDSTREQAGAGLNALTADEFAHFTQLNTSYKQRFGFPFIFAVKGASKRMIIESFERRIRNETEAEFDLAQVQVCRIFRFRIEDRVLE